MIEIERKFLVRSDLYKEQAFRSCIIEQAYLNSHPERSVRVRIKGKHAYLTIKGKSPDGGLSRFEWEKEICIEEARQLMQLCEAGKIHKKRWLVQMGKHIVEIDEFLGNNQGLVLAEIELSSTDEQIQLPSWIGKEVTGNPDYYNASLVKNM